MSVARPAIRRDRAPQLPASLHACRKLQIQLAQTGELALRSREHHRRIHPRPRPPAKPHSRHRASHGHGPMKRGRRVDREQELDQLTERGISERGVGDPEAMYKIAQGYAALGHTASAWRVLENPYLAADPLLEPLRGEAEFVRLLSLARERCEAFRRLFF